MRMKTTAIGVILVLGLILGHAFAPVVRSGTPMTPAETAKSALLQIRGSGLLPEETWDGWDGSESGLSEGNVGGTPQLGFDNVTISLPPDNSNIGYPNAAGLTWPDRPYGPHSKMYISIGLKYVDSNLLKMKTVLFHELVHVSQWRDTDGHYDNVGGIAQYNWTKQANMTNISEVKASAMTIKFLQSLLQKGEFKKSDIWAEIKREMDNLQKHLKDAIKQAGNITGQGWGTQLLQKWFPRDLVLLILWKKFMVYGMATPGTIKVDEVGHINEIKVLVEDLDGFDDDSIYGLGYGESFFDGLKYLRGMKEIRGHLLVNAVMSYHKGEYGAAMDKLNAYIEHINAQRGKFGDEVCDNALELVNDIMTYMMGTDVFPPIPIIVHPPPGIVVLDWVLIDVVEASGADDVGSTLFEVSPDGAIWIEIGVDNDPTDGWWMEWDSRSVSDGEYFIKVTMTDFAGNEGTDEVFVIVDNVMTGAISAGVGSAG